MNLFIFTNSTGCMCYEGTNFIPNASYVDGLQEYHPEGMWINGVTILNVHKTLPQILKGTKRIAVLHFGVCEALSHPPVNFLNLWIAVLLQQLADSCLYQTFIVPKMVKAVESLANEKPEYFLSLEPKEFEYILDNIFWMLQGTKTLIVGMSQPNSGSPSHWISQAWEYNEVMKKGCEKYNVEFLDIWESFKDYVQDSSHLNIEGHKQLLEKVKYFIGENNG
jgi:hypothetical protein